MGLGLWSPLATLHLGECMGSSGSAQSWGHPGRMHHAFATFMLFPRGPHPAEYRARKTLGLSQHAPSYDLRISAGIHRDLCKPCPHPEAPCQVTAPWHGGSCAVQGGTSTSNASPTYVPLPRIYQGGRAQWGFSGHHPRKGKSCTRSIRGPESRQRRRCGGCSAAPRGSHMCLSPWQLRVRVGCCGLMQKLL